MIDSFYFILALLTGGIGLAILWTIDLVLFIKEIRRRRKAKKTREGDYINSNIPEVKAGYIEDKTKPSKTIKRN